MGAFLRIGEARGFGSNPSVRPPAQRVDTTAQPSPRRGKARSAAVHPPLAPPFLDSRKGAFFDLAGRGDLVRTPTGSTTPTTAKPSPRRGKARSAAVHPPLAPPSLNSRKGAFFDLAGRGDLVRTPAGSTTRAAGGHDGEAFTRRTRHQAAVHPLTPDLRHRNVARWPGASWGVPGIQPSSAPPGLQSRPRTQPCTTFHLTGSS